MAEESKKEFSLMIASAFYEVKAYAPQIPCLIDAFRVLDELGIRHTYLQLCGDSYPCRAKNALVHSFLKTDFTHLMILDSDETWDVEGFARLIRAAMLGPEIVAGLYPCKNNWEFYGGIPNMRDGFLLGKEIGDVRLLDMWCAPGGFIIYSREVFDRIRPYVDSYLAPETGEYILECFKNNMEFDGLKRHTKEELGGMDKDALVSLVLANQPGGRKAKRVGEDVFMQLRVREAGGKIWCEPNINMGHFGIKEWKGNYHEFLLRQKTANDLEASLGESQADTKEMLEGLE